MPPGSTVLVTGAGKRLGAIIARHLAMQGYRLVIHYGGSKDGAEAMARETGGIAVQGDLADPESAARLIDAGRQAFARPVAGLINSASQFEFDRPERFDPVLLDRLTKVNLASPITLAAALAAQDDLDSGAIVNVLDQKVANLNHDFLSYTLTKVALEGATTMLAQAFAPRIRVNAVSPGLVLPSGDQSEAEFEAVASRNLLQRPVAPQAIAGAVAFLLAAENVTGQNLFVDNGQRFLARDGDVMFEHRDG